MKQQEKILITELKKSVQLKYLLYLPPGYDAEPGKRWPCIFFLHGSDERGDDLNLIKINGIPKILEQREDFPFIVISPQCPVNMHWISLADEFFLLYDEIIHQYAVDQNRVYFTGISMGGTGVWYLATFTPEKFAAAVPICANAPLLLELSERIPLLKNLPFWAFHGEYDDVIPLHEVQKLVTILQNCGGNIRFTVFPQDGHHIWDKVYYNPEVYDWLLSKGKS